MAAKSDGRDLLKVLGEYGVFLVEMGSLKDIYGATRTSTRIKVSYSLFLVEIFGEFGA